LKKSIIDIKVLLIIPCYNEELRLKTELFIQFKKNNPNIHFLFVDDGSHDTTPDILKDLCTKMQHSNFLRLDNNVGKAEAIRTCILGLKNDTKNYDFIGYFDADLSTPLEEVNDFLRVIEKNPTTLFVMGSRLSRLGSNIIRKKRRHYLGRVLATVVSIIIKERIYDSQCGAKLIKSLYVQKLFEDKFTSKWLFDVELIIRWNIYNPNTNKSIYEHPLKKWSEVSGSKLKIKDFLSAPFELLSIWIKYRKHLRTI